MRKLLFFVFASLCSAQILTPIAFAPTGSACVMPATTGFLAIWKVDTGAVCSGGCSSGSTLTSITDVSGNSNTLTGTVAGTYQTNILNTTLPALQFNGTSTVYNFTPIGGTSLSVIAVAQLISTTHAAALTSSGVGSGAIGYYLNYSGSKEQGLDIDGLIPVGSGTAAVDLSWHIVSMQFAGATSYAFQLGGASDGGASTAQINTDAMNQIGRQITTSNYGNFNLYFEAIYNGVMSTPTLSAWHAYLSCLTALP